MPIATISVSNFNKVVEALEGTVPDVCIIFKSEGLIIQSFDSMQVDFVNLSLEKAGFDNYTFTGVHTIGIALADLGHILSQAMPLQDRVTFKLGEDSKVQSEASIGQQTQSSF